MLVVTANWGFSDGTLVASACRRRAARAWLRRVRLATIRAGFGRDGIYRPPAGLDIVLAGDTLDGLASAAWRGRERPWHGGIRSGDVQRAVLQRCARRACVLLAGLAALVRRGLPAPAADRRGRPSSTATVRVPVSVALLAGDRDRQIIDLAAEITSRGAIVAQAWCDGAVFVRHGHEFDPACHVEDAIIGDRPPSLDESVAVDLVARFAVALAGTAAPRHAVDPLVEALVAAAPVEVPGIIATWRATAGGEPERDGSLHRLVEAAWRRAVDAWVREARRDPPDVGLGASPVEDLAAWFAASGTGAMPATLATLLGGWGTPVAAAVDGRAEWAVLGHPVRSTGADRVICLGRPAVRRWHPFAIVRTDAADAACVAVNPQTFEPPTISVRRSGRTSEWRHISGDDPMTDAVGPMTPAIVDAA